MVIQLSSYKLSSVSNKSVEKTLSSLQRDLEEHVNDKNFVKQVEVRTVGGSILRMNLLRLIGETIYLSADDGSLAIYDISLISEIEIVG